MILATTGVHEHGFNRMVRAVDELAGKGILEDVFIQTGYSSFEPEHCRWNMSVEFEEFERLMDKADIIITHGGAGCIAGALERRKPTIVIPRLKRYDEHNNDHQLELASVLSEAGRILLVEDVSQLANGVMEARNFVPSPPTCEGGNIVDFISDFIRGLE